MRWFLPYKVFAYSFQQNAADIRLECITVGLSFLQNKERDKEQEGKS